MVGMQLNLLEQFTLNQKVTDASKRCQFGSMMGPSILQEQKQHKHDRNNVNNTIISSKQKKYGDQSMTPKKPNHCFISDSNRMDSQTGRLIVSRYSEGIFSCGFLSVTGIVHRDGRFWLQHSATKKKYNWASLVRSCPLASHHKPSIVRWRGTRSLSQQEASKQANEGRSVFEKRFSFAFRGCFFLRSQNGAVPSIHQPINHLWPVNFNPISHGKEIRTSIAESKKDSFLQR